MKTADAPLMAFARFAGEMAESLSFNRSVGQIYGLLYLSETPLSLDDIALALAMSKGNASINLRALESWGAVQPVAVAGSRRDHYEAVRDLKALAIRRLKDGLGKRLERAETTLDGLLREASFSGPQGASSRKRLLEFRALARKGHKYLDLLPKLAGFLP